MQYLCNQLRDVCGAALTPTHISSLYCVQSFQPLTFASVLRVLPFYLWRQ